MQMIHRRFFAPGAGPEVQLEAVDMREQSTLDMRNRSMLDTASVRGPDSASDYEGDKYLPHPAAYPTRGYQGGYPAEK